MTYAIYTDEEGYICDEGNGKPIDKVTDLPTDKKTSNSDGSNVIVHTEDKSHRTGMRKMGAVLGDGVEIGCGCVLAPGCIVGKNTTAYPLTFLRGAIPENSIVKSMKEIVEKRI